MIFYALNVAKHTGFNITQLQQIKNRFRRNLREWKLHYKMQFYIIPIIIGFGHGYQKMLFCEEDGLDYLII